MTPTDDSSHEESPSNDWDIFTILDPLDKAKWLDALESGNYPQARNSLRKMDEADECIAAYCCIAVGVAALKPEYSLRDKADTSSAAEAIGINSYTKDWLVGLNDDKGYDFQSIAEFIRRNL